MSSTKTSRVYKNEIKKQNFLRGANPAAFFRRRSSKMPKLRHGVGANCTVLTKFIHPSEHVRAKHANIEKGHTTLVILVGKETLKV
jgi:hypothetical protein